MNVDNGKIISPISMCIEVDGAVFNASLFYLLSVEATFILVEETDKNG
jgi:hypothetical protein